MARDADILINLVGLPKVYLAGPITGLSWEEATEWRREAADHLGKHGIQALDPLRRKDPKIAAGGFRPDEIRSSSLTVDRGITTRDRNDVLRCDVVLANLEILPELTVGDGYRVPYASPGTMIEFGWADAFRKPIVCIMGLGKDNPHDRGLVRGVVGFFVETLEEGLSVVEAILS